MNLITKTVLLSMSLLSITPAFAKRAWDPRCSCTFGMPQPKRKEIVQGYCVGDTFTLHIRKETMSTDLDYIKNIVRESGIIECLTDLDAIETSADFISVTFRALKPGKVLLFREIRIQHADNPFGNRIAIIDHYATIDMLHACLTPSRNNSYPKPNSNADDITFKHWFDSDADGNTFKHSNNLEKMPHCDK